MAPTPQKIIYNVNSWEELEYTLSTYSQHEYKARGTVFEWFCKFYLMTDPRYRIVYKQVLHSSEFLQDSTICKRLGFKHNKEEGCDLIGITFEGKYDIIQCKYTDDKYKKLTAKHVEAPIRVATTKKASKWVDTILSCSNRQGLTDNNHLKDSPLQFLTCMRGNFESLNRKDFQNIKATIDGLVPSYTERTKRRHQEIAIDAVCTHFKTESLGQMIHACGTGKTLTSYFIFDDLKPDLTLFVVPSLPLITQTLTEWSIESIASERPISPFVVCSDKKNEKISEHDPQLWLQDLSVKVSNKPEDLERFLNSQRPRKVIFTTYNSGKIVAENLKILGQKVDFAFFDEAHHTATKVSGRDSFLLSDDNLEIKKRMFMTATPKKLVGTNDKYQSMDDKSVYGTVIDEITVKDAIEGIGGRQLLNDYCIVTQLIDDPSLEELVKENPFVEYDEKLSAEAELKMIASALTLEKTIESKGIKNIVSFHGKISRAKAFKSGLNTIFKDSKINTYHVNGEQSSTTRQGILSEFANNSPSLVTNSQCLTEGVNVPSIDAVIFVDPKQSTIQITQAIGRALRKGDASKGESCIIVPIVANQDDPDSMEQAFQQILMVLRSMSEHDGRIVEYFRLIAEGKKPTKNFIEIDAEYLGEDFDLDEFIKKLNVKAWSRFAKLGRRPWPQAREWARGLGINSNDWREFCKTDAKPVDIPADPSIAYRKEWNGWPDFLNTESDEDRFYRLLNKYKEYAKGKKNPCPPDRSELGSWSKSQRGTYKTGQMPKWKEDIIEKELIAENLFDWLGPDAWEWRQKFYCYRDWKEETGKDVPPKGCEFNGRSIEPWYQTQKVRYLVMKGTFIGKRQTKPLDDWQFQLLKSINFLFEAKLDSDWQQMYDHVMDLNKKYKGKIPNIDPVTGEKFVFNGVGVKRWIGKQRTKKKEGKLTEEEIRKLNLIPYWSWVPFEDVFNKNLVLFLDFIDRTGIANPIQNYSDEIFPTVGIFLSDLRKIERDGDLQAVVKKDLQSKGVNFKAKVLNGNATTYDY
jgi:superfamily II DNA or RNA helicase